MLRVHFDSVYANNYNVCATGWGKTPTQLGCSRGIHLFVLIV